MKNFFKGISFTQVLAGSLAAVTSFLLASKIGIAGSVIGVAIGSIVSAVASQLYQNVIRVSSKKIAKASDSANNTLRNQSSNIMQQNQPTESNSGRTISSTVSDPELENTRLLELSALREQREEDMALSDGVVAQPVPLSQAVHSTYEASPVNEYHDGNNHRLTIVIAVMSALLGVVITAGIVLLFTQGKGTDNINQPAPSQQHQPQQPQQKQYVNSNTRVNRKNSNDTNTNDKNTDEDADNKDSHNHDKTDGTADGHSEYEQSGGDSDNGVSGSISGDKSGSGSGNAGGFGSSDSGSRNSGTSDGSSRGNNGSSHGESSGGSSSENGEISGQSNGN